MTLRRGASWGAVGPLPADAVDAPDDAAAAALVERARREGRPPSPIRLLGGDLWRTCGGGARRPKTDEVARLPVDIGVVRIDGIERVFLAHLVARGRSWWFGPLLAVCNAQYRGAWDVAPRSHPADGRLDIVEVVAMPIGERWRARRRLATGTHVPHPGVVERRVCEETFTFERPRRIWLDGVAVGRSTEVAVRIEPGGVTICV